MDRKELTNWIERKTQEMIAQIPPVLRYKSRISDHLPKHAMVIGIRGTGKTTFLSVVMRHVMRKGGKVAYIYPPMLPTSTSKEIYTLVEDFFYQGYVGVFIDEIHRVTDWQELLLMLYEFHKDRYIWVSGSNSIHLSRGVADLVRRYVTYLMPILSLREYYLLAHGLELPPLLFPSEPENIWQIVDQVKLAELLTPDVMLHKWIHFGTRPFFLTIRDEILYRKTLQEELEKSIYQDVLSEVGGLSVVDIQALQGLVAFLRYSSIPRANLSDISQRVGISKPKLYKLLYALHNAFIVSIVPPYRAHGRGKYKFFLYDPALYEDTGCLREAIFVTAMRTLGIECYASKDERKGDFVIILKGKPVYIEIGGKNKKPKSADIVFRDDILYPQTTDGKRILPLWTLGFLW